MKRGMGHSVLTGSRSSKIETATGRNKAGAVFFYGLVSSNLRPTP
jgi:hypothetical protein